MKRYYAYYEPMEVNMKEYYIAARPTRSTDLTFKEPYHDDSDSGTWRQKARRLQARRWQKIRHQIA